MKKIGMMTKTGTPMLMLIPMAILMVIVMVGGPLVGGCDIAVGVVVEDVVIALGLLGDSPAMTVTVAGIVGKADVEGVDVVVTEAEDVEVVEIARSVMLKGPEVKPFGELELTHKKNTGEKLRSNPYVCTNHVKLLTLLDPEFACIVVKTSN